jgi:ABC-type multidrug transport system ATPase subunit
MEKMMASLAIRVALMNVSCLPKPDILIIDEGFGALDEINVEACGRLLKSLKKWFKSILVISHIDAVKDNVDHIIEINKNGKDSMHVQELSCKMCLHLLRKKDFDPVQKYGVCLDCMFDFVEPDMEAWKNGKRPTKKIINEKLSQRLDNPFFFVRDRPI